VPFTPYSDEVHLKHFKIDPIHGEVVVSMRFPPDLRLPTHYHTGTVIGHTMKGAWRYIEANGIGVQDLTSFEG
jgi:2,4'-dihydroxyacetophenone dioxygenase